MSWTRTSSGCTNGVHTAHSDAPFGLTVWGTDSYTSYGYPAGMSVRPINTVVDQLRAPRGTLPFVAGEELRAEKVLASDPDAALGLLIAAWRESFDPALGRLIEQLGASVAKPLETLPLKKGERAEALTRLIDKTPDAQRSALLTSFEEFARESPGRMVWPSIDAWAEAKRDPRVARMALRVLTTQGFNLTAKLWRRLVNCIEEHGDLGVVEDASAYLALLTNRGAGWGFSLERFSNVLKKLTRSRQCKLPADARAIEAMAAKVGGRTAAPRVEDASAMITAIGDYPHDDGPKLVYADWLIERKQPAGEFIVLQIARSKGKPTPEARAREADLLATHRTPLLGPFERKVARAGLKFERGFLSVMEATANLPAHPFTRLLRRVTFGELGFESGARFDSLEEAEGPPLPFRDQLPALAPRLRSWSVDARELDALIKGLAAVPLESLTLRKLSGTLLAPALPKLFASAPRLSSLEVFINDWATPALVLEDSLREVIVHLGETRVAFTRADAGWELHVTVGSHSFHEFSARGLAGLLAAFPEGALLGARLEIRGNRKREHFEATERVLRSATSKLVIVKAR